MSNERVGRFALTLGSDANYKFTLEEGEEDMSEFKIDPLSSAAIEMLGQLYVSGPTWDGNVCSKQGRSELCRAGLAWHQHGYASLTPEGVRTAVEWPISDLQRRYDQRWVKKRRDS